MKSVIRPSLVILVALCFMMSGSALITYARGFTPASENVRAVDATSVMTTWLTTSATLDDIDPGKPALSVGTRVENVVFADQKRATNDAKEDTDAVVTSAAADDTTGSNEPTLVAPVEPDPVNPTGNPLYDIPAPGESNDADVASLTPAQLAANDSGEKPALSRGSVVENVVFADSVSSANIERAAARNAAQATTDDIAVWYGLNQRFGQIGEPQLQVNVLGQIITPTGAISAAYTLNGGPSRLLGLGPDTRRLAQENDFNVELLYSELTTGTNTIVVTATDHLTTTSIQTVTVNYSPGNVWPERYTTDWSTGTIQDSAQVIDGHWSTAGGILRPLVLDYDRLVGIGDIVWQDYEVTVPVTIHAIDADGFRKPSSGPGIGFLLRWQGHYQQLDEQPTNGWKNFGAIGWYRWGEDANKNIIAGQQMLAFEGKEVATNPTKTPSFEVPYMMKMSVHSSPNENRPSYYRFKTWPANQKEPVQWDMETFGRIGEPKTGSMAVVAHHVDASFGNVTIRPLSDITSTIATATDDNGTILVTPSKDEYSYGDVVTFAATANEGFAFSEWGGDLQGSQNPLELLVTQDISLTASFVVPEPAVISTTVQGDGMVKVTPEKTQYEYDEVVSFTAIAEPGYEFTGWSGSLSGQSNPLSVRIRDDLNVMASFVEQTAPPNSDDFRTCKLDEIWTVSDPKGDSTVTVNGQQALISVPANSSHDLFRDANNAPRIVQDVPNEDFIVEAKFESKMTERFQTQGIIVEQDANNYMRMEFFHDGTNTRVFAAYLQNNSLTADSNITVTVPAEGDLYMRVGRSGNTWTQEYSFDGLVWMTNATFDHTLTVARAGVYGGNVDPTAGEPDTAPAYTAIIDYFFNTASRIEPEDGSALTVTTSTVGQGTVNKEPETVTDCSGTFTLTATPEEEWEFAGWSGAVTSTDNPLSGFSLTQGDVLTATFVESTSGDSTIYLPIIVR